MLAYYAMLTLGRLPDAQRAESFARTARRAEKHDVTTARLFPWAVERARAVLRMRAELEARGSFEERFDLLAANSNGSYSTFVSCTPVIESPTDRSDPVIAWSREQLRLLASRSPADAARALLSSRLDGMIDHLAIRDPQEIAKILNGHRDWISQFLPPESLALYRQSRPAATERR
jgi:hypothetical protein